MTILYKEKKSNNSTHYLGAVILSAAFLWAFWPVFSELVKLWSNNEDYSHGFFIIPVVIYLIWKNQEGWQPEKPLYSVLGLLGVVVGIVLYFAGLFSQFRTLEYFSFILTGWGVVFFLFGYHFFKKFAWELFLLVFMLPIPSRLYAAITLPLQLVVTKMSFIVLQLFGIPVFREGNLLQLPNTNLEVVNACSGLRSILTIIVLAFVISCLFLRRTSHRLLLIVFAVPLAMLTNLVRVTVIALFAQHGNPYFAEGIGHAMLGVGLFSLNLVLLIGLVRVFEWISTAK
jgi:exosortase